MQDFGEALADIHDRLNVALPVRVRRWRVFLAAYVEALSGITVLVRRHRRDSTLGLPNYNADADMVVSEFQSLEGQSCTSAQIEQAQDMFQWAMALRQRRMEEEQRVWLSAVQAGLFLGSLTVTLLLLSALLSLITDHPWVNVFIVLFILTQAIAGFICYKRWLRP